MSQEPGRSTQFFLVMGLAVAVLAIAGGAAYWFFVRNDGPDPKPEAEVVKEETASEFYTSLAALDVEQNELAARLLEEAVKRQPDEPALWANLAVAQMRLRQLEAAEKSLNQALALAPDSTELLVLKAEVLQHSGQIEAAIEQLRKVHESQPENIAATFSLVQLLGGLRSAEAEAERLKLLSDILDRVPENVRARAEQARIAATLNRADDLRTALDALARSAEVFPEQARQQLSAAEQAAKAGDFRKAALSLTFFENIIKPSPQYQEGLAQLGKTSAGAIGTPLRTFLKLELPPAEAAEADTELAFALEAAQNTGTADLILAMERAGDLGVAILTLTENSLRTKTESIPFPGNSKDATKGSIAFADLNFDFHQDVILAGAQGVRIVLGQADGSFQPAEVSLAEFNQPWRSVWPVDVDTDGDLDLLLSGQDTPLRWMRNNGDMTFTAMENFLSASNVRLLQSVDLDNDGDVDLAMIDDAGRVTAWRNERGGKYVSMPQPIEESQLALAVGDVDRDGQFGLVVLSASGALESLTWKPDGSWSRSQIATWSPAVSLGDAKAGDAFLAVEDIDNNGGVDVIASAANETAIWLKAADVSWTKLNDTPKLHVTAIVDVNSDGLLDLVGQNETGGHIAVNQSEAGYGWHIIKPTATTTPGDKRINSFGIGGRVVLRAGNLVQATSIRSPRVHFGLGRHDEANVAGIFWPNGTFQAEFELAAGEEIEARQRLKGSCPWVFAFDGKEFRFIKDFIWRSPLGLRINAQTTAGVVQTEDWIKLPGSSLAEKDGRYLVRITAELWETHFFDQVALVAVDHPAEVEIFVDERFIPNQSQSQKITVATKPKPFTEVTNHRGARLDEKVRFIDETYADDFALGEYQGVAEEHWIEFELPEDVTADRPVLVVGHGWVYPTDSSINVAIGQRSDQKPYGFILEQQVSPGTWKTLIDNLGFPAGKNKDVLIELPEESLETSRRFRLRTNMEVYWDALGWSYRVEDGKPRVTKLSTAIADLRQRGYSELKPTGRRRPDTPIYQVEALGQRWLDLEGFYTRFGDVRELLAEIDDRYVIMNAGDEFLFEFEAGKKTPEGWKRDFVLIGDGWVKDGDFNTAFSPWVRPLPSHDHADYAGPLKPLWDDPVYQRHSADWLNYHSRYVSPMSFQKSLWEPAAPK